MEHDAAGCTRCGRRFSGHNNFCAGCGTPILPEDRERAAGWETCVIHLHVVSSPLLGSWRWRFVAASRQTGPPTLVAESPTFAARTKVTRRTLTRRSYEAPPLGAAAQAARAALVAQLVAAG